MRLYYYLQTCYGKPLQQQAEGAFHFHLKFTIRIQWCWALVLWQSLVCYTKQVGSNFLLVVSQSDKFRAFLRSETTDKTSDTKLVFRFHERKNLFHIDSKNLPTFPNSSWLKFHPKRCQVQYPEFHGQEIKLSCYILQSCMGYESWNISREEYNNLRPSLCLDQLFIKYKQK